MPLALFAGDGIADALPGTERSGPGRDCAGVVLRVPDRAETVTNLRTKG